MSGKGVISLLLRPGKGISWSTISLHRGQLRELVNYTLRAGHVPQNACPQVVIQTSSAERHTGQNREVSSTCTSTVRWLATRGVGSGEKVTSSSSIQIQYPISHLP